MEFEALLTQSYDDTLEALGSTLELKDTETADHSRRVTAYTISIAKSVPVPLPYLTVLARALFFTISAKWRSPTKSSASPARWTTPKR
jgi:HD-GYP domain-containing protein (c-di-GMP phosphodiesterase class II)